MGVERILVSEPNQMRREAIERVGATNAIDPMQQDLAEVVNAFTNGEGVDYVFDCAGAGAAVLSGVQVLAPVGSVILVALHERPFEFNPTALVMNEASMVSALGHTPDDYREVIAAMAAGKYDFTGWGDDIALDDVHGALTDLRAGKGMKKLIRLS